jgi:sulfur carrier protein
LKKNGISVLELQKIRLVKMPEMVTVEFNGEILERERYVETIIHEGDSIEFIYYFGGGNYKH